MLNNKKQIKTNKDILYNNILLLTRNKLLYTEFQLADTFQNRINLIFLHTSFLFIVMKEKKQFPKYNEFYQSIFDLIFNKIELNMREIGYGDVSVNKNMKFLVKTFYNILLECKKYNNTKEELKKAFLLKYLKLLTEDSSNNIDKLIRYFDKYEAFCFDLNPNSVLKGSLNFIYN